MRLPIVRSDTLTENTNYPDEGCEYAESCLNCPLTICKEDDPTLNYRLKKADRDRAIAKAHRNGTPAMQIALRHGISSRTVHRLVQEQREGRKITLTRWEPGDKPDITLSELAEKSLYRAPDPLPELKPPGIQT